ncbi:MAG: hypothetical protein U9O20_00745 [Patescibacteria group bacterium]|nr:hypothetical protein [Patescibacteria group bacterium]
MKKVISIVTFVLVATGACFYYENHRDVPEYDILDITKELSNEGKSMVAKPKVSFADLMGSINREEKIECDYKIIDDETKKPLKAKIYIEGDTYKSVTWKSDEKLYSLFDGETFYGWSNKTKEGYKMKSTCAQDFGEAVFEGENDGDYELDTFKTSKELFDEDVSVNCGEVDFVDLTVPSDVDFIDQCDLLKKQKEMIENNK